MEGELPPAQSVLVRKTSMRKYLPYMIHVLKSQSRIFWYSWTISKTILYFYFIYLLTVSIVFGIVGLALLLVFFNPFSDFITRNNPYIISAKITEQKISKKDWKSYFNRGLAWLNLGMFDEALKDMNAAIKLDHEQAEVWAFKAACLFNQKKYTETLKAAKRAHKLKPLEIYPLQIKAKAFQKLKNDEEAENVIQEIRTIRRDVSEIEQ